MAQENNKKYFMIKEMLKILFMCDVKPEPDMIEKRNIVFYSNAEMSIKTMEDHKVVFICHLSIDGVDYRIEEDLSPTFLCKFPSDLLKVYTKYYNVKMRKLKLDRIKK